MTNTIQSLLNLINLAAASVVGQQHQGRTKIGAMLYHVADAMSHYPLIVSSPSTPLLM
jgi:hypothetical protein